MLKHRHSCWIPVSKYICLSLTLLHNSPFFFFLISDRIHFVSVCDSRLVLAKPYASMAHASALNSNVLASTHGYTSVILNRTKSKSSDFPPSFALSGPPLLPHTLTHWVAQKCIMVRGWTLGWCTESNDIYSVACAFLSYWSSHVSGFSAQLVM